MLEMKMRMEMRERRARKSSLRFLMFVGLAGLACFASFPSMAARAASPSASSADMPLPTLKLESALYKLDHGVLEFSFTLTNPGDSVIYLDCQVPPKFSLNGKNLIVTLDRRSLDDKADMSAYPPQRIGAHQTYQGQRRFDHILGEAQLRPDFSTLRLETVYFPERSEGEGKPFVKERAVSIMAPSVPVPRRGKPPSRPVKTRIVHPPDP